MGPEQVEAYKELDWVSINDAAVYWFHFHCKGRYTLQGHPTCKERVLYHERPSAYHPRILSRTVSCQR